MSFLKNKTLYRVVGSVSGVSFNVATTFYTKSFEEARKLKVGLQRYSNFNKEGITFSVQNKVFLENVEPEPFVVKKIAPC